MVCPALELHELSCVRGGRTLFAELNVKIPAGRLLRVTGENGAGKTSLLKLVVGLLRPEHGAVLWQGTGIKALRDEFHRQIVYIGHAAALKDDLSAMENLHFATRLSGCMASEGQAAAALSAVGLQGNERRLVRSLSQGQRRRVALARLVIGTDAPLWVLDEPFNTLDTTAAAWLAHCITAHVQRGGLVMLTSHQSDLAFSSALPQMEIAL
jgi:heme exporter protein A